MLANISSELSTIQTGRYGEDIRTAIKEAIRKVNEAGYMPVVENLNVTANGTYTPSAGVNGFSKVVVNVPTSGGGGGYPEPTGTIQITANGTVNVKDYASANVNVPNSYDAADEGKVVSGGALVSQTSLSVTANGTYDTTENDEVVVNVSGGGTINLQSKTATENGTVTPDAGYDGLSSVVVNVSGGGSSRKGFELYAADGNGSSRSHKGILNNQYFACYFDDNMSQNYTLNGQSYTFSTIASGKQQTLGTTKAVADNQEESAGLNAVLKFYEGSSFTASHYDNGSYISVVGGWAGYPAGGTIFENASTGSSNSITLDKTYDKLLLFIGACFNSDGATSVEINGTTYSITNIGYHYGAYGAYGAIEIDNNSDTTITATFSLSGWSYMSIIGFEG